MEELVPLPAALEFGPGQVQLLETRIADRDSRIGELETVVNGLRDTLRLERQRYNNQMDAVRGIGIEQFKEGRWCRDGLNEKLGELGLEPYVQRFTVPVSVEVTMEVEADDEDDATRIVRDDLRIESGDDYYIDVGEFRFGRVEEAEQ